MEILCFVGLALLGGLAGLVWLIYQLKRGGLEDLEDVKYQIFRDED